VWKCRTGEQILIGREGMAIFYEVGRDYIEHYITECQKTKDWFTELGKDKDKILEKMWDEDLDDNKGRVFKKL